MISNSSLKTPYWTPTQNETTERWTTASVLAGSLCALALPGYALGIGSGGAITPWTFRHMGDWVYGESIEVKEAAPVPVAEARAPWEVLEQARKALGLSVTDLARLFDVSRPTIYAWMKGEQEPREETGARFYTLDNLAARVARMGLPRIEHLIRRPLSDGRSILDRLRADEPIDEATLAELAQLAERERLQRERGSKRPAQTSAQTAASEYGHPEA